MVYFSKQHLFVFLGSLALVSLLLSLALGSSAIHFAQLLHPQDHLNSTLFFSLRLPRTLNAFTAGSLLALAGLLMQVLLENPLADPYTLGTSSGAAFFLLLLTVLGFPSTYLFFGAWLGSTLAISLILLFAYQHQWQPYRLLLIGMTLTSGFSAGITAILLLSTPYQTHSLFFWLTGELTEIHYPLTGIILLTFCLSLSLFLAPGLNVLSRGEKEAQLLGLQAGPYRIMLFLLTSLLTAAAITVGGCIGFIGLIVPHCMRKLLPMDYRLLLPATVLAGGSFLTFADTLARTLFLPQQLPVGIITACLGVPIFIWLLNR